MMKHLKKLTAIAIATLMAITCFLGYKQADAVEADGEAGHFYVTVDENSGGNWDYDDAIQVISITESGTYTISKKCDCDENTVHAEYQIKIEGKITVNLTIEDVQISNSSNAAMSIDGSAEVTLVLEGNNSFDSSDADYHAGIEFNNADSGTLEITSTTSGTLTATGGYYSAGIGGSQNNSGNNITISGGIVTATGGSRGAGIGGGYYGDGTDITISGGIVTAEGGMLSSAIGGGASGCGTNIKISGGAVTAKAIYGATAETIGGNQYKDNDVTIAYKDGYYYRTSTSSSIDASTEFEYTNTKIDLSTTVKYVQLYDYNYHTDGHYIVVNDDNDNWAFTDPNLSNEYLISIKNSGDYIISEICGEDKDHLDYRISISDVNATVTLNNVKIKTNVGSAMNISSSANATLVLVGDNSFTSLSYTYAGIAFSNATSGTLTITSGSTDNTLTATGGTYGAGIGGVSTGTKGSSGNNITISGGTVIATGGLQAAGIGGGAYGNGSYITITGGIVTATSSDSGAGIGGGSDGEGSYITITGGIVTANGGFYGAGIGGGVRGNASNISISGGTVTATGGNSGAGIGGGFNGSGTYITISGGSVNATGKYGAGIGGGLNSLNNGSGEGSYITISGGTVIATGIDGGAGIGGGSGGDGTNITISGGNVTAIAKVESWYGGAGIGGGVTDTGYYYGGYGTNIKISGGTVTAVGEDSANDIGNGSGYTNSETSTIVITGGSVKASSMSATPTDGDDEVYLVEILNALDINIITVDGEEYTRSGNHWDGSAYNDGTFYLYLKGENHEITAGDDEYKAVWDEDGNEGDDPFSVKQYIEEPDAEFIATGDDSGTLSGVDEDMEYSLDGGSTWTSIDEEEIYDKNKTDITDVTTDGIQIIYIETETTVSYIQTIEVGQAEMPKTVYSVDCTSIANDDGEIKGVDDSMEYKLSTATEWTPIATGEEEVTGLYDGTYYVRRKASGTELASTYTTVTINAYVGSLGNNETLDPSTDLDGSGGMTGDSTSGGTIGNDDNIGTVGGGSGSNSGYTGNENSNGDSSGSYGTGSASSGSSTGSDNDTGSGSGTYDGTTLISSTGNQIIVNTSTGSITSKEEE